MFLIRGTTPTITINVRDDIDLSQIVEAWVFISQQNKVRVDKTMDDIEIIPDKMRMKVTLSQQDTLNLKEGDAVFQVRILLADETAMATIARDIEVFQTYKGGVITDD